MCSYVTTCTSTQGFNKNQRDKRDITCYMFVNYKGFNLLHKISTYVPKVIESRAHACCTEYYTAMNHASIQLILFKSLTALPPSYFSNAQYINRGSLWLRLGYLDVSVTSSELWLVIDVGVGTW